MAGTSGCIPDHEVNFFGQLCGPVPRPSTTDSPDAEPQSDVETPANDALVPARTPENTPAPDPIAELSKENQDLIRGLSLENVDTYLATVKDIFVQVRESRKNACTELPQRQQLAQEQQVEGHDECQAEHQDQNQEQSLVQQPPQLLDNQSAQLKEQDDQQPRLQSQRPAEEPTYPLIVPRYPSNKTFPLIATQHSNNKAQAMRPCKSGIQGDEDAMDCIENGGAEGEMQERTFSSLNALLMPNFTGDPKKKHRFGQQYSE